MPDAAHERLRRPPHRGHRRQARAVDPQRAQHRHGRRHRRRGHACGCCGSSTSRRGAAYLAPQGVAGDGDRAAAAARASPASATCSRRSRRPSTSSWTSDDVVLTVFTDSMDLYRSRLEELRAAHGAYTATHAATRLRPLPASGRRPTTCEELDLPGPQGASTTSSTSPGSSSRGRPARSCARCGTRTSGTRATQRPAGGTR